MQHQQVSAVSFPRTICHWSRLNDIEFPLLCIDYRNQLFEPARRGVSIAPKKKDAYTLKNFHVMIKKKMSFIYVSITIFVEKFFTYIIHICIT